MDNELQYIKCIDCYNKCILRNVGIMDDYMEEEKVKLIIKNIPVYKCEGCGKEMMSTTMMKKVSKLARENYNKNKETMFLFKDTE